MQNELDRRFGRSKHKAEGRRRERIGCSWSYFSSKKTWKTHWHIPGLERRAKWERKQRILSKEKVVLFVCYFPFFPCPNHFWKYKIFSLSEVNRKQGYLPPPWEALLRIWLQIDFLIWYLKGTTDEVPVECFHVDC